jgi:hypothetical protein
MPKKPDDDDQRELSSQDGGEILAQLRRLEKTLGPKPRATPDGEDDGETTGNTPPSVCAPRDTVEARMRKRSGTV